MRRVFQPILLLSIAAPLLLQADLPTNLWRKGALEQAIDAARVASKNDPKDTELQRRVAAMCTQKNYLEKLMKKSREAAEQEKYALALATISQILRINPAYKPALQLKTFCQKSDRTTASLKLWKEKKPPLLAALSYTLEDLKRRQHSKRSETKQLLKREIKDCTKKSIQEFNTTTVGNQLEIFRLQTWTIKNLDNSYIITPPILHLYFEIQNYEEIDTDFDFSYTDRHEENLSLETATFYEQ